MLGLFDGLIDGLNDKESEGETLADGETDGLILGDNENDNDGLMLGEIDGEKELAPAVNKLISKSLPLSANEISKLGTYASGSNVMSKSVPLSCNRMLNGISFMLLVHYHFFLNESHPLWLRNKLVQCCHTRSMNKLRHPPLR